MNRIVLSILLLSLKYYVLGNDLILDIPEPVLTTLKPNGIRITISDPAKLYEFVRLAYNIVCNTYGRQVNQKPLAYDSSKKEWFFEDTSAQPCAIGNFFYKILATNGNKLGNSEGVISLRKQDNPIDHRVLECSSSKTTISNKEKICKGELIFEDNFDVMNWTIWNREIRIPLDTEDADFVSFQDSERNLYIKDGILHIVPTLLTEMAAYDDDNIRDGKLDLGSKCTGKIDRNSECKRKAKGWQILPPIVSSRIRTKFSFKYGKVEIKAKMPRGDWIFPQIFLEPLNNDYGIFGYSSGQIRLAFIRGNEILYTKDSLQIDGCRLYGGVVLTTGEQLREHWMKSILKRNHFGYDYHVYTMIWTDESITFKVDGIIFAQLNGNFSREAFNDNGISHAENWLSGGIMTPFDSEFYLTLGVSAGGISDFPDGSKIRNIREGDVKPWTNRDAKNELNFWKDREKWHRSWISENVGLKIDYVRVWAL